MRGINMPELFDTCLGWNKRVGHYNTKIQYIPSEKAERIIEEANMLLCSDRFDVERCSVLSEELPFYSDAKRIEIFTPHSIPPVTYEFILTPQGLKKIDGTPEGFEEINRIASLQLDNDTVVSYAKFVLSHLNTGDDSFKLIESWHDIVFTDHIPFFMFLRLRIKLFGVKRAFTGADFLITAPVLYDDHLYRAEIKVTEDGRIDITGEKLLLNGVPTRDIYLE
jgi:hypothetical protein